MAGKPIKVSTFYSKKKADVRLVFPTESIQSEDSDCESDGDDIPCRSDIFIQESSHEEESEDEPSRPKTPAQAHPVRRRKTRISALVVTDRYQNGSLNENKARKPRSSRKLVFKSPEPKQVEERAEIEFDYLSSPALSPVSSVLHSPVHSDDDLWEKIKPRVSSPDIFAEFDLSMVSKSTPITKDPDPDLTVSPEDKSVNCDILIDHSKDVCNPMRKTSVLQSIENIVTRKEEKLNNDSVSSRGKRQTRKTTSHTEAPKIMLPCDENVTCCDLVSSTSPIRLPVSGKKRVSISEIPPSTKEIEPRPKRRKSAPHVQNVTSKCVVDKNIELENVSTPLPQPLRQRGRNMPNEKSTNSGKRLVTQKKPINVCELQGSSCTDKFGENVTADEQLLSDVSTPLPNELTPLPPAQRSKNQPIKNSTRTKKKPISKPKSSTRQHLDEDDDVDEHEDEDSEEGEEEIEKWREGDLEETRRQPSEVPLPENVKRPIEYFNYYFDEDLLELIVEETNNYSVQKDGKPLSLTVQELKVWLGIWLYMGICSLPNLKDYWSLELRVKQVADCMPVKRFQKIRARLHLCDNLDDSEEAAADRYRKVRPLITHMQRKCRSLDQDGNMAIDEIIIPYKGKFSSLKQYNPMKPIKYGFKFYGLADSSGIIYDFLPSCGSTTFDQSNLTEEEKAKNVSSKSVISLCKQIRKPEGTVVYFDNWFSSVSLMSYLRSSMNILSVGTIRKDRTEHCPFTADKVFCKLPRGSVESFVNSEAVVTVRWLDSKPVCLASTVAGVEPQTTVKRFDKAAGRRVDIVCPRIIELYNSHMGGVDLSDQYIAAHRVPTRSKRWYFPIVGYILDLAVINSYLQYCRDNRLLESGPKEIEFGNAKDFRMSISKSLRCLERHSEDRPLDQSFAKKKLIKSPLYRPCDEVRFDGTKHWPIFSQTVLRCKHCTAGKTTVMCSKCQLSLCCKSTRNCFVDFHKNKK